MLTQAIHDVSVWASGFTAGFAFTFIVVAAIRDRFGP